MGDEVTPSARLESILKILALEPGQFFLGGSSGLALRDLRDFGDIDIGVTTAYWVELWHGGDWGVITPDPNDERRRCDPPYLARVINGVECHVFNGWRRRPDETEFNDYNLVFSEGIEHVQGWPCLKLNILLRQKIDAVNWGGEPRAKDIKDIEIISRHLRIRAAFGRCHDNAA